MQPVLRASLAAGLIAGALSLAACGGGGGGASAVPSVSATPAPGATATATPPGATLTFAAVSQGSTAVYSCGCSPQAGTATVGANGTLTLVASATPIPLTPTPTYTIVPGRNYEVVATNAGNNAEYWTMFFAGNGPLRDQYLGSTPTDDFATLGALYVFQLSPTGGDQQFDNWNFTTVAAWVAKMRAGGVTAAETKALSDIAAARAAGTTLYPTAPPWAPTHATNPTIANDIGAVQASDSSVPTPCPSTGCTNGPTP